MPCPVTKTLTFPLSVKLLLAVNLAALAFALTMQFGFGLEPCILCLWQRVPYIAAACLSCLALVFRPCRKHAALVLALCALIYLAGLGLALFHSGVERHWWQGTAECAASPLKAASIEDLRKALLEKEPVRCDHIAWSLFGLSMANFNIVLSLALAFFAAASACKARQK